MSESLKIGVIGAQSAGKTTFFHQLYHALTNEAGFPSIYLDPHETFDNVPKQSFVDASYDSVALNITGIIKVDNRNHRLEIRDTLGGDLTNPSSAEVVKEQLELIGELDMLVLAIAPENIAENDTRILTAMQRHITHFLSSGPESKRISLAYMKCDEYALSDQPVRLLENNRQIEYLMNWRKIRASNIADPQKKDDAWRAFVDEISGDSSSIREILSRTEFLWRVINDTPGVSQRNFNAYFVQSHPADPPVPLDSFNIYRRGVTEIFEDFIKQSSADQTEDNPDWWMLAGAWTVIWVVISFIYWLGN